MKRNIPEIWMSIALIICAVLVPLAIGYLLLKLWRKFRPLEETPQNSTHAILENAQRDGFFKMFFLGWLILGPILYYFYLQSY